jgi:hypothetical protein
MTNHKTQWNYFGDDQLLKSRLCLDKHKGITFKINSVSIFYFDCEYVIPTLEAATIRVTYACFLFFLLFYHYFAILLHFFLILRWFCTMTMLHFISTTLPQE